MYKAKASKVLLLMFLSDLARVNNASSFKDEVSATDLLLFSFSLVLTPSFLFKQNTYVFTHTMKTKWITESTFETQVKRHLKKNKKKRCWNTKQMSVWMKLMYLSDAFYSFH